MVIFFPIKSLPSKRDIAIPYFHVIFHVYSSRSALQFATTISFLLLQLFFQYSTTFSIDNFIVIFFYRIRLIQFKYPLFRRCCQYLIKIKRRYISQGD